LLRRSTSSKPVPQITLQFEFEEVIADLLKLNPQEKSKRRSEYRAVVLK
jgi:hypothetical protein